MSDDQSHTRPAGHAPRRAVGPMSAADAVIPEELCVGQDAPFEALFLRHYRRVYNVLFRLVGDEADDLAQETFVRLYTHPPRGAGADVGAWLYRVAINLGYNALRAGRRQRTYRDLLARVAGGVDWQSAGPDPQSYAEQREDEHQVRAALGRLSKREASLLALRYDGLSYAEIARVLGVSVTSVGTLLARAECAFGRVFCPAGSGGQDRE